MSNSYWPSRCPRCSGRQCRGWADGAGLRFRELRNDETAVFTDGTHALLAQINKTALARAENTVRPETAAQDLGLTIVRANSGRMVTDGRGIVFLPFCTKTILAAWGVCRAFVRDQGK